MPCRFYYSIEEGLVSFGILLSGNVGASPQFVVQCFVLLDFNFLGFNAVELFNHRADVEVLNDFLIVRTSQRVRVVVVMESQVQI